MRWNYVGAYFQDDLRLTPHLALNLGVRWDLQTPYTDSQYRMSYMDPNLANPGAGNRPGAYTFAGSGQGGSTASAMPG